MKYTELKDKIQREVNAFPMQFAFSKKQFAEGMEKLGLDPEKDLDKACRIPGGGFIRKTDNEAFQKMFLRHDCEMAEAMQDDVFLVDAIHYELANHEYCITYDPDDALSALGLSLSDERIKRCYGIARKEYLIACECYA